MGMIKLSFIPKFDEFDEPTCRTIWTPDGNEFSLTKAASDSRYGDELEAAIRGIQPTDRHTYKLVTALGAADYWGQNRNGDRFYRRALLLPGPQYGHQSFLGAGLYRHHKNKDPNLTLGKVVFAHYDPVMHRVILILDYDHELLERHNAMDYLQREFPDYSMAAKVPFDVCTVCGDQHKLRDIAARAGAVAPEDQVKSILDYIKAGNVITGVATKRENYCDHLKYMMGKVLTDGSQQGIQVGADNLFPKFFDISEVTTGADPIAKEMRKIASYEGDSAVIGGAELAELYGYDTTGLDKVAILSPSNMANGVRKALRRALFGGKDTTKRASFDVTAELESQAEIQKKIDAVGVPLSLAHERPLPAHELLADDPVRVLSTLGGLGIVASPEEFQYMMLTHMGRPALAGRLGALRRVFPASSTCDEFPLGPEHIIPKLLQLFIPHMENRSFFAPVAAHRTYTLTIRELGAPSPMPPAPAIPDPPEVDILRLDPYDRGIMHKVASLYRGYRDTLASTALTLVESTSRHPEVLENLRSDGVWVGEMSKDASVIGSALAFGGLYPIMYLYAARLRRKEREGKHLGPLKAFIKEHPALTAAATLGMMRLLKASGDNPLAQITDRR